MGVPTLEQLIDEAREARLRQVLLHAASETILDRARMVSETIEQRVRELTGQASGRQRCRAVRFADRARPGSPQKDAVAPGSFGFVKGGVRGTQ